ncbi:MAG: glutamylcysteine synthetase [Clostridia bacterium]|nr:glutamylcysteine synthetase [Clostridia bacterium]
MSSKDLQEQALEEKLYALIYDKYIAPTERPKKGYAGIEFELPIVNLRKQPVDFSVVHNLTDAFLGRFGFSDISRDDNGDIYNATDPETGDCLSYDCSFNTLEFSFGIDEDLTVIQGRFREYYAFIQDYLLPRHHSLTGMGLNPYRHFNNNVPIANGRYRMLLHHLESYPKYPRTILFHDRPNFGLFSCASQVQLDAEKDTLVDTLNIFTRLEPVKALLFANSPFEDFLCSRDYFWKHSMHGVNPHNVDIYDKELRSIEEVIAYIRTMSLYCVERDDKYINFAPTPLLEYFSKTEVEGEYYDRELGRHERITFTPEWEDLSHLRSFKFDDVTFRGTIEFRSACEQPVRDIMTVAAFQTGLMEVLPELNVRLDRAGFLYDQGYSCLELRELLVKRDLPAFLREKDLEVLLGDVIDLSAEGLRRRGRSEEGLVQNLYSRASHLMSPARVQVEGLESGVPLEYYIEDYAKLD